MKISSTFAAVLFSALAFTAAAAHAETNVPFSAKFNIDETLEAGTGPSCQMIGLISGQGTAAYLGRTAVSGTNCVTPPTDPAYPVFNFADGSIILMASNGDTITGTFQGSFVPTGKGSIFTVVDGTYSFNRGTGRFSAVTGSGKLTGTQDIATGKGQLQASGRISF